MDTKPNDRRSILMIVSSMLIFGTIGIFRRHIPLSSALLAFSRGILGSLFILIFMKARQFSGRAITDGQSDGRIIKDGQAGGRVMKDGQAGGQARKDGQAAEFEKLPARTVLWLMLTGAMIGFNWILLFEAYNYTTVAIATLCYYMQPTIVMLLSPLIFKERLTGKKMICTAVAILGMVLVSGVIGGSDAQSGNLKGVLLGLGAAVLYATVVIMNKRISGIDAYRKTTIQLMSAGVVMIPYLMLTNGFQIGGFSARTIALLLIVGIVHTGIAYVLYFGSIEGLKAQTVAILSYIDPVSALLFSALFLSEPLSLAGVIGAVMIIGSALVSDL